MIETERLILKPLTHQQLIKYIKLDNSLEAELNLEKSTRVISPDLMEALELSIMPRVADMNKNYLFSTLWTLISKEENTMVGDLCFMGEPNSDGEIEIGYGTYEQFRKRGFMTEAVGGMIKWAKEQPDVKSIIASSLKSNTDSSSILKKNNFTIVEKTNELYNWQITLKQRCD